jgi:hypothetical protein
VAFHVRDTVIEVEHGKGSMPTVRIGDDVQAAQWLTADVAIFLSDCETLLKGWWL